MATDALHERLLSIVNALPDAYEDRPWGSVHCKVAGKIFVSWGRHDDGAMGLGFKTDKVLQGMLVASDPRFEIAAYVGKHGWVDMKLDASPDWREVEHFILDSYRMIAPRRLVKALDARKAGAPTAPAAAPKSAWPKTDAKKKPAAKVATKPAAKVAKKPAAKVAKKPAAKPKGRVGAGG